MCNQNSCFGGCGCWIIIAIIILCLFWGGNGCGCGGAHLRDDSRFGAGRSPLAGMLQCSR